MFEFSRRVDDALVERDGRHGEFIEKVFSDGALGKMFRALMLETAYGRLKAGPADGQVLTQATGCERTGQWRRDTAWLCVLKTGSVCWPWAPAPRRT